MVRAHDARLQDGLDKLGTLVSRRCSIVARAAEHHVGLGLNSRRLAGAQEAGHNLRGQRGAGRGRGACQPSCHLPQNTEEGPKPPVSQISKIMAQLHGFRKTLFRLLSIMTSYDDKEVGCACECKDRGTGTTRVHSARTVTGVLSLSLMSVILLKHAACVRSTLGLLCAGSCDGAVVYISMTTYVISLNHTERL